MKTLEMHIFSFWHIDFSFSSIKSFAIFLQIQFSRSQFSRSCLACELVHNSIWPNQKLSQILQIQIQRFWLWEMIFWQWLWSNFVLRWYTDWYHELSSRPIWRMNWAYNHFSVDLKSTQCCYLRQKSFSNVKAQVVTKAKLFKCFWIVMYLITWGNKQLLQTHTCRVYR